MPSGIPAQGLSAYEVCVNRVDERPVVPAALMHTCSATLKETEWSCKPNTLCVCVCVLGKLLLSIWTGHRQSCRNDEDDLTNRTCQIWPNAGAELRITARKVGGLSADLKDTP